MKPYFETKLGKLYHGDCLEIMPELNKTVDMILSDPPYGITNCNWDSIIPLKPMWGHLKKIIKSNSAIVMTTSQPFTTILISSNMRMFKYCWVWDKQNPTNFLQAKKQPLKYHEDICVFYNKQPSYNPIKWRGKANHVQGKSISGYRETIGKVKRVKDDFSGMKFPRSIIEIGKNSNQCGLHPTQKPVALMEYLIATYTNKKEMVLDFACGSGTTLFACEKLTRHWIGVEISEKYCEIAAKRIDREAQQLKLFR